MSEQNIYVYFVGTAGSGKSTMTGAFNQWLKLKGLDSVIINLDPGAEALGYSADVDIREWINLADVMKEHDLGPNGAQIACADMLAFKAEELADLLEGYRTNYFLIDTPGQLELFSFRKASNRLVETLGGAKAVIAFTIDPVVSKTPEGFISQLMLRATVQFRFSVPVVSVLTKADLLTMEELETVQKWATCPEALNAALWEGGARPGASVNLEFLKALESVGAFSELVTSSSEELAGFEDLYNLIQQCYMGGEDLSPD